ncbi:MULTISPECIES: chromate transporter [unclassified Enterococcus]|uniref:chromate transporter n=1 Tax=unclassified Enterococcus TaxID=2608891 RepID=UPI001553BDC2|nr:chromate transporter [Enterococcus sp. MMGLQ5-2]MBS7584523.1 chromate transporter [Enterococcus sp. MMGLQ5-1]NPD12378.1 chromate transporter [Enterococcus sp. MMGLQ5-1]NPD36864.1 chromate transporter [Enterococcus sp. MMGLQ5-2]
MIYWRLFTSFLKISAVGFGGGYAMLSMVLSVSKNLGLTVDQFTDLTALDLMIPGPIAVNSATYVGYLIAGILGSLIATLAVCIPSFIYVPIALRYEQIIKNNPLFKFVMDTIKASVVGLIIYASITIIFGIILVDNVSWQQVSEAPFSVISPFALVVFIASAYVQIRWRRINPIFLIIVAGILGYLIG